MGIISSLIAEDDLLRIKMGRFSDADEREMKRLVSTRDMKAVGRLLAGGVRPTVPAYRSSRPTMRGGGQTFVFAHTSIQKGRWRGGDREVVFRAPPAVARGCGARLIRQAGGGAAWVVRADRWTGQGAPVSARFSTGFAPGTARAFQRYMERPGAVEENAAGMQFSLGSIAEDALERERFWDAVEDVERAGGRVQQRLIAELPHEQEVGGAGRIEIVDRLGRVFDDLGLPWHAVVHLPGDGDARNYHLHLAFHDRPVVGRDEGAVVWGRTKVAAVSDRHFLGQLRDTYADISNDVLRQAGLRRRYDPSRYADVAVVKPPGVHLGTAAAAAERQGKVTAPGRRAAAAEAAWRLADLGQALRADVAAAQRRVTAATALTAAALLDGRDEPVVVQAAERVAGHVAAYIEATGGMLEARARRSILGLRDEGCRLRLERAAERHPDAVARREAAALGATVRDAFQPLRAHARVDHREAGQAVGRTAVRLDRSVARLDAVLQLHRLQSAERRLWLWRSEERRLSEAEWQADGHACEAAVKAADRAVVSARGAAAEQCAAAFGTYAGEIVAGVENPRSRRRTLEIVRARAADGDGGAGRRTRETLEALIEALRDAAEAQAREARWRRLNASPERRAERVMTPEAEREWRARGDQLRAVVVEHEATVARNPLARRLLRRFRSVEAGRDVS